MTPAPDLSSAGGQTRLAFGMALTHLAEQDPSVIAVSADSVDLIGLRTLGERFPDRLIEAGIAEQNAMGIASGLATTGLRPFLCGYAPFITARSMEQIRNDVAYADQRVVIGAAASGISLGVAGGTHHAVEDIAVLRSFPGMTVIVPADVNQTWQATLATDHIPGPVYLRLGGRFPDPDVVVPEMPLTIGKADMLRAGNDVTVIACGSMVGPALEASDSLAEKGRSVRVLNMHTIKPLDHDALLSAARETAGIVTAEEHHLSGGLGGAVSEFLAQHHPAHMRFVGMPDRFAMVGPTGPLRAHYGMSATAIANACDELLK